MRYKIEINLLALKNLESKINLEEAVLLDYIYWLCSSPSEEVEKMRIEKDGKKYTWFDYSFYIQETPIIKGKTKGSITPKIKKLEKEKFIETINYAQEGKDKFSKKYIRLLPKVDGLFRKLNKVVQKTKQGVVQKTKPINILHNNKYITDNITTSKEVGKTPSINNYGNKKNLNEVIALFEPINPSYRRLFVNITQRAALERMIKQHGQEKIEWIIKILPKMNKIKYSPTICTPIQLENKLGQLIAFIQKEQGEYNKNKIIKI